jgi:hypothetical protein
VNGQIDTPADEEARAALWRDQARRRAAYQAGLWQALAGDPVAAAAFHARWEPVTAWLLELQEPITDPEDDLGQPPPPLSDMVNVGRLEE